MLCQHGKIFFCELVRVEHSQICVSVVSVYLEEARASPLQCNAVFVCFCEGAIKFASRGVTDVAKNPARNMSWG